MRLDTWHAPPGDRIPNHPSFAVLVYRDVEPAARGDVEAVRALFAQHGWRGDGGPPQAPSRGGPQRRITRRNAAHV